MSHLNVFSLKNVIIVVLSNLKMHVQDKGSYRKTAAQHLTQDYLVQKKDT